MTVVGLPDAAKTLLVLELACRFSSIGVPSGILCVDEEPQDILCRLVQRAGYTRKQFENATSAELALMQRKVGTPPFELFYDVTIEEAAEKMAAMAPDGCYLGVDSVQTASCRAMSLHRDPAERTIVSLNMSALRRAATHYRMITVGTSESNREYSKSKEKGLDPNAMNAGAESRAIEYRARCQLVMSSDGENTIEVLVPKNKLGRRDSFNLHIDFERQTLSDAGRVVRPDGRDVRKKARQRARIDQDAADRAAAAQILTADPKLCQRDYRARMSNATGAGHTRADAARIWWLDQTQRGSSQ
jgi:hypothetical protein